MEKSKAPYDGKEFQMPGEGNNNELAEEEKMRENQLIHQGFSPGEARSMVIAERKARDEKALNGDISPQKAKEEIKSQE